VAPKALQIDNGFVGAQGEAQGDWRRVATLIWSAGRPDFGRRFWTLGLRWYVFFGRPASGGTGAGRSRYCLILLLDSNGSKGEVGVTLFLRRGWDGFEILSGVVRIRRMFRSNSSV